MSAEGGRMRPTRARDLVVVGVVCAGAAYALLTAFYVDIPRLPRTAPLSLLLVGLAEGQTALSTRNRLAGRPGTRPIAPLTVARYVALAKASSAAAAALCGAWAGALAYVWPRVGDVRTAGDDALTSGLGLAAAAVLLAAALALERVCRVRDRT